MPVFVAPQSESLCVPTDTNASLHHLLWTLISAEPRACVTMMSAMTQAHMIIVASYCARVIGVKPRSKITGAEPTHISRMSAMTQAYMSSPSGNCSATRLAPSCRVRATVL